MKRIKKKRPKIISRDEFKTFMTPSCVPIKLEKDAIPKFLTGLTKNKKCEVYASGYKGPPFPLRNYDPNYSGFRVGGIELYRDARMEHEPFEFNVDSYGIIHDQTTDNNMIITGPEKPVHHWTNKIASGLQNVEQYLFKYPNCPKCGSKLIQSDIYCDKCNWKKY